VLLAPAVAPPALRLEDVAPDGAVLCPVVAPLDIDPLGGAAPTPAVPLAPAPAPADPPAPCPNASVLVIASAAASASVVAFIVIVVSVSAGSIGRQMAGATEVPALTKLRLLARVSEGYHGSVKLSPIARDDQRRLNRWNSCLISARKRGIEAERLIVAAKLRADEHDRRVADAKAALRNAMTTEGPCPP
jgi:hypothetical protein